MEEKEEKSSIYRTFGGRAAAFVRLFSAMAKRKRARRFPPTPPAFSIFNPKGSRRARVLLRCRIYTGGSDESRASPGGRQRQ